METGMNALFTVDAMEDNEEDEHYKWEPQKQWKEDWIACTTVCNSMYVTVNMYSAIAVTKVWEYCKHCGLILMIIEI